jgi:hypothetical protein
LIEEVRSLGLPIVGVISDKQESSCLAVEPKRPLVPHQLGHVHDLKDVAQPVCEADRQVKKELKKQIRGIRAIARQAVQSSTQAANMVADYCLAIRTVMRDEGKYPLEPPGVQLYQKLPLMAASVERVRVAHPSNLLNKLARMLAVLNLCQKAFEPLVLRFSWIYHIAHLLNAETRREEAQSPLLTYVTTRRQSCPSDTLWTVVASIEKSTVALTPQLCEYLKPPLWPHTHNDLELFIGRLKQSRRPIPGRKNTQDCILREGRFVAMLLGLPHTHPWVDAFPNVHLNEFRHTLHRLRQTEKRRQCWPARHEVAAYLASLEQPWVPQE